MWKNHGDEYFKSIHYEDQDLFVIDGKIWIL